MKDTTLTVFTDGVVRVSAVISVDENEASITLPLLAHHTRVFNVIVLDESAAPLDYEFGERNITIYSLGARSILLEYDTDALTRKEAGLWTLTISTPFELKVVFPENSMLIYMNAPPSVISSDGGKLKLTLYPGYWEISYELLYYRTTTQTITQITQTTQPAEIIPTPAYYALIACTIAAIVVGLRLIKRRKRFDTLKTEEAEIVRFLKEKNGRALEAELREAFPNVPRTTMWRLIKRLEKKGILKVRKVGLQNLVELV
ncbi:MAG: hypothetical protein RMJ14_06110 [Nitrososphaerota archaeon]|nr:hypothetical protein [Aigarchaeota archaeon]MDW8077186.1 hypothetical protein [Nitrososphaerota archaeon]